MPVFYRFVPPASHDHVVTLRIFLLPPGPACVVSWPPPQPGMRVFTQGVQAAIDFAEQVAGERGGSRLPVDLEESVQWQPAWGELVNVQ